MEPSTESHQDPLIRGWSFGELGDRPPAEGEVIIPPAPASLNLRNDGDQDLFHAPSKITDREEGGNDSSASEINEADDMMRIDVESPAQRPLIRGAERGSVSPPHMTEGDGGNQDLPVLHVGVDGESAEATVHVVAEERPAEREPEANQTHAQGPAAQTEGETPCKICFNNLEPQDFIFLNCGCLYCAECLNAHFRSGLANKASYPPRCCDQLPIDIEAIQGFLDDENMVRYTMVQEEFSAARPLFCANKECTIDFIGDVAQINLRSDERMVICYGCALQTCTLCRELRDTHTDGEGVLECPDSLVLADVKVMAEEEKWRRCPGCRFLVEKIDGCDHMICDCRTEFDYICGQEYSSDGRCGCMRNPGWADDGNLEDGDRGMAPRRELENQLPPQVQADLHREEGFPFTIEENTGFDPEEALQNIVKDTEMLLMALEDEQEASETGGTAQAIEEESVTGEGAIQDREAQEVAEAGDINHPAAGEEHGVRAVPTNQIDADNDLEENPTLHPANETLRAALDGFRNATERLRTAAAEVVNRRQTQTQMKTTRWDNAIFLKNEDSDGKEKGDALDAGPKLRLYLNDIA